MLDDEPQDRSTEEPTSAAPRRRRAAGRPAGPPEPAEETSSAAEAAPEAAPESGDAPAPRKRTRKKAAAPAEEPAAEKATEKATQKPAKKAAAQKADDADERPKRTRKRAAKPEPEPEAEVEEEEGDDAGGLPAAPAVLFQAPAADAPTTRTRTRRAAGRPAGQPGSGADDAEKAEADGESEDSSDDAPAAPRRRSRGKGGGQGAKSDADKDEKDEQPTDESAEDDDDDGDDDEGGDAAARRRRRRRGGRGRRGRSGRPAGEGDDDSEESDSSGEDTQASDSDSDGDGDADGDSAGSRRRRRRRRRGDEGESGSPDDPEKTTTRVRSSRAGGASGGEVTAVRGSTRLEAKKQRRREGREAGRRRVPILSEAEFLARREAVERVMIVKQNSERTQIAVLEDGVLVEHYVNKATASSLMGDIFLGRVQNVLPSMEAAFVDIGKGRNAVLYAGEVNFEGLEGQPKRIEHALKSGQSVLVQVTKDPMGHKGARLTSQISLPGRYLVYVPDSSMTGISRKLPDSERTRLKNILRQVVPDDGGVIVRTAAEGASEDELRRDVERLAAQWEKVAAKAKSASAPALLLGEPDLTTRVVRDVFNEDFTKLIVSGETAFSEISDYLERVAPDLAPRLSKWAENKDVFTANRVDEQILKALDRKVWLPSGGSLVIDRTEAMTVVDVNTGKFTGSGGNLEETVTKNNLEAAEEIVRQLRLRDIGGIIVVDFIDMVLESNRELVLRRLVECLGRDRTKHQVAEVTSLGLVQMTRKRIGQGLLEAYAHICDVCNGRGHTIRTDEAESRAKPKPGPPSNGNGGGKEAKSAPAEAEAVADDAAPSGRTGRNRRRRGRGGGGSPETVEATSDEDTPDTEAEAPETDASDENTEAEAPETDASDENTEAAVVHPRDAAEADETDETDETAESDAETEHVPV